MKDKIIPYFQTKIYLSLGYKLTRPDWFGLEYIFQIPEGEIELPLIGKKRALSFTAVKNQWDDIEPYFPSESDKKCDNWKVIDYDFNTPF